MIIQIHFWISCMMEYQQMVSFWHVSLFKPTSGFLKFQKNFLATSIIRFDKVTLQFLMKLSKNTTNVCEFSTTYYFIVHISQQFFSIFLKLKTVSVFIKLKNNSFKIIAKFHYNWQFLKSFFNVLPISLK